MRRYLFGVLLALGLGPTSALAENLMFDYWTTLSVGDTYNSSGASLSDFCTVVQQDRANVHRFGNPDRDVVDGFFNTPARRAMIAGNCDYARGQHSVQNIRSGFNGFVWVRVYGTGNTVTRVLIVEGAG